MVTVKFQQAKQAWEVNLHRREDEVCWVVNKARRLIADVDLGIKVA